MEFSLRPFLGLFIICVFTFITAKAQKELVYQPRAEYFQRLEPKGKILVGAGQASFSAFDDFIKASDSIVYPDIYMDYAGLDIFKKEKIKYSINKWMAYPFKIIPQIGLAMTHDGDPEKHFEQQVAKGLLDSNIEAFANEISKYPGKVMIRIGYEFNGHWNGYKPDSFKLAYIRVANVLRRVMNNRVALVWCMALDGDRHDYMNFYPGDEFVDWWSVDVFGEKHFTHPALKPFLASAHKHKKPVLIGESTPRKLSVQLGKESVQKWFYPYFKLMATNPGIKGFSYIYWDWSKTRWADWGNGRFGENPETKKFMIGELTNEIFQSETLLKGKLTE